MINGGAMDVIELIKNHKVKTNKVWDFSKKEEVEVDVVWINAKGKDGT